MKRVQVKRSAIAATIIGCLLLCAGSAQAQTTELAPGGSVNPTPTYPGILGGNLLSSLSSPFSLNFNGQVLSGTVVSAVYQNGAAEDGVFGGANLDFYYQIRYSEGNSILTSVNAVQFADFRTSVGQTPDGDGGLSVFSSGTERSVFGRRTIDGNGITFDFIGFTPRENSYTLVVRTNARAFDSNGSIGLLASGISTPARTLSPVVGTGLQEVAAPEPGTLALLGVGLGVIGLVRRRRMA